MPEDIIERLFDQLAGTQLPVPTRATVAARGRQRRRRDRVRALLLVAAVAAVVVGIGQLAALPHRSQSAVGHRGSASAVCVAEPTVALALERRRALPMSTQLGVSPIALDSNGTSVYLETTARGFRGIAEESLTTGAILTKIKALSATNVGARGGLGPDGELVWTGTYSIYRGQTGASTPMQVWSPRRRTTTTLEPAGQHGGVLGAPVFRNQTIVAWEQADGREQEIVEANLATGAIDVIARGYLGQPVFVGPALVWPVASQASGPASRLVARNAGVFPALRQIAVPLQLRAAASPGTTPTAPIASNGTATAYFSPDLTEMFYSPSPSQSARMVLRPPGGATFAPDGLVVGDGYLGWTVSTDGSYLASTTTLAAVRISDFGSVVGVGSDYVIVGGPPFSKSTPRRQFHLFQASTVNALTCASPPKSTGR